MPRSIYEVQAWNDQPDSENRIHSDEVAQVYGFESALVAGVIVFGHMTYLPVQREGIEWLRGNQAEIRFLKPAYDGDILTIEHEHQDRHGESHSIGPDRTLLATMSSRHGQFEVSGNEQAASTSKAPSAPWVKTTLNVDKLTTGQAWPPLVWTAEPHVNTALAKKLNDDHALYCGAGAPVHPYWLLHQCNEVIMQAYLIPAWIHVGSTITFHEPIPVGAHVETRAVLTRLWERKGHSFATLMISFVVDNRVQVEVEHTAIFRIARPESTLAH